MNTRIPSGAELARLIQALKAGQRVTLHVQHRRGISRFANKIAKLGGGLVVVSSGREAASQRGLIECAGYHELERKLIGHRYPFLVFDDTLYSDCHQHHGGTLHITSRIFKFFDRLATVFKPGTSYAWAITDTLQDLTTLLKAEGFYEPDLVRSPELGV